MYILILSVKDNSRSAMTPSCAVSAQDMCIIVIELYSVLELHDNCWSVQIVLFELLTAVSICSQLINVINSRRLE